MSLRVLMTATNQFHKVLILLPAKTVIALMALCSASVLQAAVVFKSLNSSITIPATAIQGGLLLGMTEPGNTVWLDNNKVQIAADGSFIIGFGRTALNAELKVLSKVGVEEVQNIKVQSREYNVDRIDGLPPAKVNPKGEAVLKRIKSESRLVKRARKTAHPRQNFKEGFIWPAKGRISGVYGSQRILNGDPKWPHYGLDIAAPTGADVIAPVSGIVTLAHNDMYYSGGTLILDHGQGLSSTFLHLSEILVKEGQYIDKGAVIAKVGATGRVTGAHLDWRINWFTIRLDPQFLVDGISQDSR
ncbi:MAG: murein DD-endopeptidase MepM/ murein hydrolase activator NlpD [Enterobacterales bacterium]